MKFLFFILLSIQTIVYTAPKPLINLALDKISSSKTSPIITESFTQSLDKKFEEIKYKINLIDDSTSAKTYVEILNDIFLLDRFFILVTIKLDDDNKLKDKKTMCLKYQELIPIGNLSSKKTLEFIKRLQREIRSTISDKNLSSLTEDEKNVLYNYRETIYFLIKLNQLHSKIVSK